MNPLGGTFITVGNAYQAFSRFWDIIRQSFHVLPKPIVIQYGESPPPDMPGESTSFAYCTRSEFNSYVESSAVIIGHAGAGTLILANAAGHRPIMICREARYGEHIDDHQSEFALKAQSEGLAWVCDSADQLKEVVSNIYQCPLGKKIVMPAIHVFSPGEKVLIAAAVGGHLTEALRITDANQLNKCQILTDAERPSDPDSNISYFPACTHRILFPMRVFQATIFLIKNPNISTVFTTGTSIGSAFGIASIITRRRFIALETITRINSPSTWFRISTIFPGQYYAYSWSKWSRIKHWWRKIKIVDVTIEDFSRNEP